MEHTAEITTSYGVQVVVVSVGTNQLLGAAKNSIVEIRTSKVIFLRITNTKLHAMVGMAQIRKIM